MVDSQLSNSIDLKVIFLLSLLQTMKKCAADIYSDRRKSSEATRLRLRYQVHLYGFLLSVSENSRIIQGDVKLQITLADYVFKMKYALHSELSMLANSKRS